MIAFILKNSRHYCRTEKKPKKYMHTCINSVETLPPIHINFIRTINCVFWQCNILYFIFFFFFLYMPIVVKVTMLRTLILNWPVNIFKNYRINNHWEELINNINPNYLYWTNYWVECYVPFMVTRISAVIFYKNT